MQGFNRYVPPDYDPKTTSTLNKAAGKKHALGNRAKDIDKGILIVRFELPFNIWCGTCGKHIGAGVRYNARKQKVGNYYSTPIFGFKCKCHLCDGWFEIRTDPKNAAYEVFEGAKKQDLDWNPEENGGFAAQDTDAPSAADAPVDPIAHIEKTIDQAEWAKKNTTRISELSEISDRQSADPYLISSALRRRFREEKKIILEKQGRDDGLKSRFGLHDDVDLGGEDVELGKEMWEAQRERAGLPVDLGNGESSTRAIRGTPVSTRKGKGRMIDSPTPNLASLLRKTTARKYDPFSDDLDTFMAGSPTVRGRVKAKEVVVKLAEPEPPDPPVPKMGMAVLAGYDSD